jgi:hypothetical protein
MYLGQKIKVFGDEKFGGNVTHYSQATGKSRTDLYRYFQEKSVPGADFIEKLYELGCDMDWLLGPSPVYPENIVAEESIVYMKSLKEENDYLKQLLLEVYKNIEAENKNLVNLQNYLKNKARDISFGLEGIEVEST